MKKLTFIEIKNQLETELKLFTMDDLLVKSPLQTAIELFKTVLNWQNQEEIRNYFLTNFKFMSGNMAMICLNKEISDNLKLIEQKLKRIENLKQKFKQREKNHYEYAVDSENLFSTKKITPEEYNERHKINEEYKKESRLIRKTKVKMEAELSRLRIETKGKQGNRRRAASDNRDSGDEPEAFKWLYSILFFKDAEIKEIWGYAKRDSQYVFDVSEIIEPLSDNEKQNYRKTLINYELHTKDADIKDTLETIVNYSTSSVILPFNWKDIMREVFYTPLPNYFGTLNLPDVHNPEYNQEENKGFCFQKDKIIRSHDYEKILLQLKMATLSENFLITQDKKILFSLYGNATAKVTMRRKGEIMKTFFTLPLEIVINQWKQHPDDKTTSCFLISQEYVIEVLLMDN